MAGSVVAMDSVQSDIYSMIWKDDIPKRLQTFFGSLVGCY